MTAKTRVVKRAARGAYTTPIALAVALFIGEYINLSEIATAALITILSMAFLGIDKGARDWYAKYKATHTKEAKIIKEVIEAANDITEEDAPKDVVTPLKCEPIDKKDPDAGTQIVEKGLVSRYITKKKK